MISKQYLAQLHAIFEDKSRPNGFGGKVKKLGRFYDFMEIWQPKSLLDYGCGKGVILNHLQKKYPNILIEGYDPAMPDFTKIKSSKYECVFSNDVLEHIESDYIVKVMSHINNLATKYIWLRIDTLPARKTLPDGRNAHILLESDGWWLDKISSTIDGNIIYTNLSKGKFDVAITK